MHRTRFFDGGQEVASARQHVKTRQMKSRRPDPFLDDPPPRSPAKPSAVAAMALA
jgi:hypothetical protein